MQGASAMHGDQAPNKNIKNEIKITLEIETIDVTFVPNGCTYNMTSLFELSNFISVAHMRRSIQLNYF